MPGGIYKTSTDNHTADPFCMLKSTPPVSPNGKMPQFCKQKGINFSKGVAVEWQDGVRAEKSPYHKADTAWKIQLLIASPQEEA